jgi:phage protein D
VGQVASWLQDCCKQYNSIAELEEHLSSYDHHHKKRLADLKKMDQERTRGERNKKESKRQAKEAARLEKQCVFFSKSEFSACCKAMIAMPVDPSVSQDGQKCEENQVKGRMHVQNCRCSWHEELKLSSSSTYPTTSCGASSATAA